MNRHVVSLEGLRPLIDEQLHQGKDVTFRVKGNSMFPFLRTDQTDVTLTSPPETCKKMDVILFRTEAGKYILHRIVKVEGDKYLTMGDGLRTKETTSKRQVVAIMKAFSYKDKTTSADSQSYRFKVRIWICLSPFRSLMLGVFHRLERHKNHG